MKGPNLPERERVCVGSIFRISQATKMRGIEWGVYRAIVRRAGGGGGEKLKINRDASPGTSALWQSDSSEWTGESLRESSSRSSTS